MARFWALIPAAGSGSRFGGELPKQYCALAGHTVLEHSLAPFIGHPRVDGVIVAIVAGDRRWPGLQAASHPRVRAVTGGVDRSQSVLAGLRALSGKAVDQDWVLVHDAARPCLDSPTLDRLMTTLSDHPVGGLLALPVHDTVKQSTPDGTVAATLDRRQIWRAQTPQMFRLAMLRDALEHALASGVTVTDESSALEAAGHSPRLVEGNEDNLKITRAGDLARAQRILDRRTHGSGT